jgi:hypothetical protein
VSNARQAVQTNKRTGETLSHPIVAGTETFCGSVARTLIRRPPCQIRLLVAALHAILGVKRDPLSPQTKAEIHLLLAINTVLVHGETITHDERCPQMSLQNHSAYIRHTAEGFE